MNSDWFWQKQKTTIAYTKLIRETLDTNRSDKPKSPIRLRKGFEEERHRRLLHAVLHLVVQSSLSQPKSPNNETKRHQKLYLQGWPKLLFVGDSWYYFVSESNNGIFSFVFFCFVCFFGCSVGSPSFEKKEVFGFFPQFYGNFAKNIVRFLAKFRQFWAKLINLGFCHLVSVWSLVGQVVYCLSGRRNVPELLRASLRTDVKDVDWRTKKCIISCCYCLGHFPRFWTVRSPAKLLKSLPLGVF